MVTKSDEIKKLKEKLREWQSPYVKEQHESVNSTLHLLRIDELKLEIKRLRTK